MPEPSLAMLPSGSLLAQAIGVGLALTYACVFFARLQSNNGQRSKPGKTSPRRDPVVALGWSALILGPALGELRAVLAFPVTNVNPLDYGHYFWSSGLIGGIAGFLVASVCLVTVLTRRTNPIGGTDQNHCDQELIQ